MLEEAQDIRCYCRSKTLLARFALAEESGEPVIHIKAWRGENLHTEVVIVSGVVRVRCRNCKRWHRIRVRHGAPRLEAGQKNFTGKLALLSPDGVAS